MPAPQLSLVLAPVALATVPDSQGVQSGWPLGLDFPGEQRRHLQRVALEAYEPEFLIR